MLEKDVYKVDVNSFNLPSDTIVAQLSGPKSVAAIVKAIEDRPDFKRIVPVISFSGIEANDVDNPWQIVHFNELKQLIGNKVTLFDPIIVSVPRLWQWMAGKTCNVQVKKFGFYSPCLVCQFYFHMMRVIAAAQLGKTIISEAEIRQKRPYTLRTNFHTENLMKQYGIEWVSYEVEVPKGEIKNEHCAFGGSLKDEDRKMFSDLQAIDRYFYDYLMPVAQKSIDHIINNKIINNDEIAHICKSTLFSL